MSRVQPYSVSNPCLEERISSNIVKLAVEEWYEVVVPHEASIPEADRILAELDVFFRDYYGRPMRKSDLEVTKEENGTRYRFAGMQSTRGHGLHPEIYPNAVAAWQLVSNEKTWG